MTEQPTKQKVVKVYKQKQTADDKEPAQVAAPVAEKVAPKVEAVSEKKPDKKEKKEKKPKKAEEPSVNLGQVKASEDHDAKFEK